MAIPFQYLSLLLFLFFFFFFLFPLFLLSPTLAQPIHAVIIPVHQDPSTHQYIAQINMSKPTFTVNLVLDLEAKSTWVNCERNNTSTAYVPTTCPSATCSSAGSQGCGNCLPAPPPNCDTKMCELFAENTVTGIAAKGYLGSDSLSVQSTDGKNPGAVVYMDHYLFVCGPTSLLTGLPASARGMTGLGMSKTGFSYQLSFYHGFTDTIAMCLPSSPSAPGFIIVGYSPYQLLPNVDASASLTHTPLISNPMKPSEYYIGVSSININGKAVPMNSALLSIDQQGNGGTKLSTLKEYTVMETSIHKAVIEAFINALSLVPMVTPVMPFTTACFNSTKIGSTRVGPAVPQIDLVLQNATTIWTIFGANSMVTVSNEVMCLGVLDGGLKPEASIVIGTHMMQDNLVEINLDKSTFGVSSSLLLRQTTCSNFNFTSNA